MLLFVAAARSEATHRHHSPLVYHRPYESTGHWYYNPLVYQRPYVSTDRLYYNPPVCHRPYESTGHWYHSSLVLGVDTTIRQSITGLMCRPTAVITLSVRQRASQETVKFVGAVNYICRRPQSGRGHGHVTRFSISGRLKYARGG